MRSLVRFLSALVTPLCVAFLLCEPSSLARDDQPAAEEGGGEEHFQPPHINLFSFDYRSKNAEGEPWHEGEHKMPPPFSMQLLNFIVYAVLMYRMAGPSIARMTRDRHDAIAKALAESTKLRDEAKAKLDEYGGKVAALDKEIQSIVASIRAEADAEAKRIVAEAEARAERMRRDAEQQIQAEIQRVRILLEHEAVEAAVGIARRLLVEKTTDADQRLLADRFVKGIADAAAGARRRPGA